MSKREVVELDNGKQGTVEACKNYENYMEMVKINYSIVNITDDIVTIRDEYSDSNPTMTITNGAAEVVAELVDLDILGNKRLLYYDSDGHLDEIIHTNGEFVGFCMYVGK